MVFPKEYYPEMKSLCENRRGKDFNEQLIDDRKYVLRCRLPMSEIIVDFVDHVKSISHGYGSFDYEFDGFEKADIVKIVIHIMNDPVVLVSV